MASRLGTVVLCAGGAATLALSFWFTLKILEYSEMGLEARTTGASLQPSEIPTKNSASINTSAEYKTVIGLLRAGKVVIVYFDDNPAEDRDANRQIRCGNKADDSYLGVFIAGERYEISFNSKRRVWSGKGPNQKSSFDPTTNTCGSQDSTYGPAEMGSIIPRPENGELLLWGAMFTFDEKLKVYDTSKKKVGQLEPGFHP